MHMHGDNVSFGITCMRNGDLIGTETACKCLVNLYSFFFDNNLWIWLCMKEIAGML